MPRQQTRLWSSSVEMTITDGLVHGRAGERVAERALAVRVLAGRGMAERDVLVQRRVLEARRGLDRRDDLARDAELREAAERRLLVGAEIAHGLVEADQALLDQVLGVAAGEEVRARLQADEAGVAADQLRPSRAVAVAGLEDELEILKLSLSLLRRICACGPSWTQASPRFSWQSRIGIDDAPSRKVSP